MSAWPLPRTAGRTAGHRLCKSFRRVKLLHTQMHMQRTGNHGLFAAGFALTDMRPRSRDSKTGVASAPAAWNCTQSTVSSAAAVTSPRVSVRALRLRATPLEHMNSTHTHSTHTHSTKTHSTHSRPRTPCGAPDATLCFFLPSLSRSPSPLTSSTSPSLPPRCRNLTECREHRFAAGPKLGTFCSWATFVQPAVALIMP